MDIIKKINKAKSIWEILPTLDEKSIEDVIKIASDYYYNKSISLISDSIYDILIDKLKELNPKSKIFKQIGAPIIKGKKTKLPYWMGSMNKLKYDEDINLWVKKYPGPYLISDKLDGISCLLTMTDGKINLYTRGDGTYGQNISHLLNIINISYDILKKQKIDVAVRGELIMKKDIFYQKYSKIMANARNMVGGITNSKEETINKKYAADVDFIVYEIIEPQLKPSEQMKQLKKWDMYTVPHDTYTDINFEIIDSLLQKRKKQSIYEIDGIIVTDNKLHSRNKSGNPSYAFAYKGTSQTKETTVIKIIWKPSKDGYLVPVVNFQTIHISGVEIRNATGFNAKFIKDNKIGKDAIITVIRSGDTIPYITGVVKKAKQADLPYDMEYEWDKNGVNIMLVDADSNELVIVQRLTKFLKNIGVEYMSEGIVTKLVQAGYDTIPKIISLTEDQLMNLEGFKETLASKLINEIQSNLNKLDMLTLMVASNCFGRGFGERKIRGILNLYSDIVEKYDKAERKKWLDKLIAIEGFDTISVDKFLDMLPDFQKFYKNISKQISVKPYENIIKKNGIFQNEIIVFTGFRNDDWKKIIEKEGGKITGSVSKNTTLLVYNDGEELSIKYKTAQKLGVKTMKKSEFEKKYRL